MQFVDKNYVLLVFAELGHYLFEALLKLAAVLGAGDHEREVERKDPFFLKKRRHLAVDDALGEPLDDRGLADARLTDQDRIVLCPAAQNLDQALDLILAADQRIEPALGGLVGQIACKFGKIRRFRRVRPGRRR